MVLDHTRIEATMINFPVLESIEISDYGLYPGQAGKEGLHVSFQAGLTLVLGTNGLGKTTLITILFRLLTGTYDISGITDRNDLGNNRLIAKPISSGDKRIFAQRVVDNARNAKARLNVRLGKHSVMIERRLNDLGLTKFVVDGIHKIVNEEYYQDDIARMVGVWSFGDWILLVRHLVFYFEDRRSLVWDPTAQRMLQKIGLSVNEPYLNSIPECET
jgi:energy-coupling factor transporter ATP-binding protein EcfA2